MTKARRYQLKKDAVALIERHPWIFREQMSTAAAVIPDGALLAMFDGANRVVGHGIYEAEGAIAIRVLRRGPDRPDAAWVKSRVEAAIAKRAPLRARSNAMRLVHGESDELPAVVIDRFGDTLVVQSYALGADALARYAAICARRAIGAEIAHVIARPARRRRSRDRATEQPADATTTAKPKTPAARAASASKAAWEAASASAIAAVTTNASTADAAAVSASSIDLAVYGGVPPAIATITEDGLPFAVDLAGQKSGAYLDLRGLRAAVAQMPLANARVLNLFSYSGMLARIAERRGAAMIVSVDQSARAIEFLRANHVDDASKHELVVGDAFDYAKTLPADAMFDLAIVDPPSMTSSMQQVTAALAAYRKLYGSVASHVSVGGAIVAACCTSRIARKAFRDTVAKQLGDGWSLEREIPTEIDHPVGFPQADYLKIAIFRRQR